jgi:DNA (cytosine-5)-methyltransferase 1
MSLTVGSFFSGIGGLDLGLERAGFHIRFQVENDPFCQRVLEHHWPGIKKYGDIRTLNPKHLERVDLICGGIPCQPHSYAGKRKGTSDSRWLWPEFFNCIRILRPKFALIENVPGFLSSGFGSVLCDLASCGYDAEWNSIRASDFGAPHQRERVFILAYSKSFRLFPSNQKTKDRIFSKNLLERSEWWLRTRLVRGNSGRVFRIPETGILGMADVPTIGLDRYRVIGNAVAPIVSESIGKVIIKFVDA